MKVNYAEACSALMIFEDSMSIHSGGGIHLTTDFLQVGGSSLDAFIKYIILFKR